MNTVKLSQFRDNLSSFVDKVISTHAPIKVTQKAGGDFVAMSAKGWEREQETLYVLQNNNLMQQIVDSTVTHN